MSTRLSETPDRIDLGSSFHPSTLSLATGAVKFRTQKGRGNDTDRLFWFEVPSGPFYGPDQRSHGRPGTVCYPPHPFPFFDRRKQTKGRSNLCLEQILYRRLIHLRILIDLKSLNGMFDH